MTKVGVCIPGGNGETSGIKAFASNVVAGGWVYATYSDLACNTLAGVWKSAAVGSGCVADASHRSSSPVRYYVTTLPTANIGNLVVTVPTNIVYPSQTFYMYNSTTAPANQTCNASPVIQYIRIEPLPSVS